VEQTFVCMACKKQSPLRSIEDLEAIPYVVCQHCRAKNKLFRLKTFTGGPPEFIVIGLKLDHD
jgi:DNA-directed RNA polymerase subunit RPC12/RpoP